MELNRPLNLSASGWTIRAGTISSPKRKISAKLSTLCSYRQWDRQEVVALQSQDVYSAITTSSRIQSSEMTVFQ